MAFLDDMADAAKVAVCSWLSQGGNGVVGSAVYMGLRTPGAQVPALAAGLGLVALNYGCNFDPNRTGPDNPNLFSGCRKASSGTLSVFRTINGEEVPWYSNVREVVACYRKGQTSGGVPIWHYNLVLANGTAVGPADGAEAGWTATRGVINTGGVCADTATGQDPPTGVQPPVEYTTPGGCQLTINHDSWLVSGDGSVRPVLKIESQPALPLTRASGGVIGGCNFGPIVFVGGDGGGKPPWIAPWVDTPSPDGGKPWWLSLLEQAGDAVLEYAIKGALDAFFEQKMPATIYRLVSACELDPGGEPVDRVREVAIPSLPLLPAIAARLDALPEIAQGLKDFRQPVCEPPSTVGTVVNVRFDGQQASATSGGHLRKVFRYRSVGSNDLAAHREHWRGFEWESGPFMVISTGARWGKPQVWASSPAEGERVLMHAAAVAGVSLSPAAGHRFIVREVLNPRYSRRETMRPMIAPDGGPWVTDRQGPGGWPQLPA